MEYRYEKIEHNLNIPVKIFTHTLEEFPYHWHEDIEILFVLKGEVEIFIDKEVNILKEGDIFLVNKNEIHYVKSVNYLEKSQLLALQFNSDCLKKYKIDLGDYYFKLDSSKNEEENHKAYNQIKSLLAMMMNVVINKEEPHELLIMRHLIDLVIIIINNFNVSNNKKSVAINAREDRVIDIIKYINENYKDSDLTVAKISEKFYLNSQYISRYFKENTGISIKSFIENVRLNKSLNTLKLTKDRVIDIAHEYGFPDEKAYYRVFKNTIGITPNQYREMNSIDVDSNKKINYFNINSSETLIKLFEYIKPYDSFFVGRKKEEDIKVVKTDKVIGNLNHSWNKLITFGHASYGLRADFIAQLKEIQQDMSFEYIRFHGIFSDEMLVYNETSEGEVYYNFNHVDSLLDLLLDNGLKPFIELGFMPKELSTKENQLFYWDSNISSPKSMDKWENLIEAFTKHIINRYGIDRVQDWYFEFWNEPNLEGVFWDGSREEFFDFFKHTYEVMKSIDSRLKVGGFGYLKFGEMLRDENSWLMQFKKYANKNKCLLDFFTFHVYQLENAFDNLDKEEIINMKIKYMKSRTDHSFNFSIVEEFSNMKNEKHINNTVKEISQLGTELSENNELWITEWNANMDCRDLVHDTCFMASFIVKTCIENCNFVEGMGFWTFTDLFEEFRLKQPLFHGGFGLMTYNGLKKASYNAFLFLNKLGKEIIYQEDGLVITKKGEDFVLLLYNYCHYNQLYGSLDYSQITETNRYNVFEDTTDKIYNLSMKIKSGKYIVEKFRVNRDEGSIFDAWVNMGHPNNLSKEGYRYLENKSQPSYMTREEVVEGNLFINTEVLAHEIQLINIKKIY